MLKRILILLFALIQTGCYFYEEQGFYATTWRSPEELDRLEREKREFLQLEDLKIGNGPVAALGRKVSGEIEVRYADGDGTPIYHGPAIYYFGMQGYSFIHDSIVEDGLLNTQNRGIMLGLNGMAVSGTRRITIPPQMVCSGFGTEEANPNITCGLVYRNRLYGGPVTIQKRPLIVEATLTASCTPVSLDIVYFRLGQVWCRDSAVPQRDSNAPIWRVYQVPPSRS